MNRIHAHHAITGQPCGGTWREQVGLVWTLHHSNNTKAKRQLGTYWRCDKCGWPCDQPGQAA